jgi:molybdate transport system ATP-binding protein
MSGGGCLYARLRKRIGRLEIDVELDTGPGTLVLVGPNGAGKSSVLSLVLGAIAPEHGLVRLDDEVLCDTTRGIDVTLEARRLGYVPQDYALFPHLNVRDNVAFGPRSLGLRGDDEVDALLDRLGLLALADGGVAHLSGGDRQRVALARALAVRPRALLLDEPLAALDLHARQQVRDFLATTLATLGLPTLLVSHDPADARRLGTRVAVLEAGRLTQIGPWSELERRPASRFVEQLVSGA